jgi:hypothetical protein
MNLKRTFLTALVFSWGSTILLAIPYAGTFAETITSVTSWGLPSQYTVGEVFKGSYSYESDTADGTYFGFNTGGAPFTNFQCVLFVPDLGYITFSDGWNSNRRMEVTGGAVSDFWKEGQIGWSDFYFGLSDFTSYSEWNEYTGTMTFDAPSAVPDFGTNTLMLAVGGIFGSLLLHRIMVRRLT